MADPVTGLTKQDCQAIVRTWEVIGRKDVIKNHGVDLLIALFKAYPYMQDFFEKFRGQPLEELKTSCALRAQAMNTMRALKAYVNNVEDAETLAGLVTKTANIHLPKGIRTVEMENLAVAFTAFMSETLGDQWTAEAAAAWTQLLKVHNIVYKQVEDSGEQQEADK